MCGRKSGKGMYVYAKDSKDRPMNQVISFLCAVFLLGAKSTVQNIVGHLF